MSELLVNTIKKADGTGSLTVPADTGTVVIKDGSNDVTLNNITATGVYLGGTGAANYLDDFETGTWAPTVQGSNTSGTYTPSTVSGVYTKIGDLVCIEFAVNGFSTASGGSGYIKITGMPFNKAANNTFSASSVMYANLSLPTSKDVVAGWNTYGESAVMLLYALNDFASRTTISITGVGTNTEFSFSAIYKAV